jgi:hypothetical protein
MSADTPAPILTLVEEMEAMAAAIPEPKWFGDDSHYRRSIFTSPKAGGEEIAILHPGYLDPDLTKAEQTVEAMKGITARRNFMIRSREAVPALCKAVRGLSDLQRMSLDAFEIVVPDLKARLAAAEGENARLAAKVARVEALASVLEAEAAAYAPDALLSAAHEARLMACGIRAALAGTAEGGPSR